MAAGAAHSGTGQGPGPRLAGSLLLAVFAALALANALDRAAPLHPKLASLVPERFATRSLAARAEGARAAADYPRLATLAGQAVAKEPLEPANTALLGAARLGSGDTAGADRAFRVAGQLGWRIPLTQIYWMARAAEVGDTRVAAQRLDAVLRADPEFLAQQRFVDPLEQTEPGREALRDRLALRPDWLDQYLGLNGNLSLVPRAALLQRAAVVTGLPAHGLQLGCANVTTMAQVLLAAGAVPEASALWHAHCRETDAGPLADGDFARADLTQASAPFGWQFPGGSDIDVSWPDGPPAGKGRALVVSTTATATKPVARQLLLVPPGRYALHWRAEADAARPAQALAALSCRPVAENWLAAAGGAPISLTVDAACPVHWLILGAKALHAGTGGEVRISAVRLTRLP